MKHRDAENYKDFNDGLNSKVNLVFTSLFVRK